MGDEIDVERFRATATWCVYIHRRPDGSPFYVGKGLRRRAFDLSPSRRTKFHQAIVSKYGRDAIRIQVIHALNEDEAFALEKAHIAIARAQGHRLANLTDGGEGCSGRPMSEAQRAAFAKGRGRDRVLSPESMQRVVDGLKRGRQTLLSRFSSPEERTAYYRNITRTARAAPRQHRDAICAQCGAEFKTTSTKAKCCSRLCEQRHRRHRDKWGFA